MSTTQNFRTARAAFEAPPEFDRAADDYEDYLAIFEADRLTEWVEYQAGVAAGENDEITFAEFCEEEQPMDYDDWVEEQLEDREEAYHRSMGREW